MKPGDPEYSRQLDVISAIPSNKTDDNNLSGYTDQDMRDFELRHLRELTEQAQNMDVNEQIATARGIRIEILHNVIGEYIAAQQQQNAQIASAINQE